VPIGFEKFITNEPGTYRIPSGIAMVTVNGEFNDGATTCNCTFNSPDPSHRTRLSAAIGYDTSIPADLSRSLAAVIPGSSTEASEITCPFRKVVHNKKTVKIKLIFNFFLDGKWVKIDSEIKFFMQWSLSNNILI